MVIGIGGCSRSGKTELSEALVWHFRQQNKRVFSVHQDNYVFEQSKIPTFNDAPDWDTPLSIDFNLLLETIEFYKPKFEILIVEGIYAFHNEVVSSLYDTSFYVEISQKTFWQRRRAEIRWGIEPDWYLEHVWESHLRHGLEPKNVKNLHKVSGEVPYEISDIVNLML